MLFSCAEVVEWKTARSSASQAPPPQRRQAPVRVTPCAVGQSTRPRRRRSRRLGAPEAPSLPRMLETWTLDRLGADEQLVCRSRRWSGGGDGCWRIWSPRREHVEPPRGESAPSRSSKLLDQRGGAEPARRLAGLVGEARASAASADGTQHRGQRHLRTGQLVDVAELHEELDHLTPADSNASNVGASSARRRTIAPDAARRRDAPATRGPRVPTTCSGRRSARGRCDPRREPEASSSRGARSPAGDLGDRVRDRLEDERGHPYRPSNHGSEVADDLDDVVVGRRAAATSPRWVASGSPGRAAWTAQAPSSRHIGPAGRRSSSVRSSPRATRTTARRLAIMPGPWRGMGADKSVSLITSSQSPAGEQHRRSRCQRATGGVDRRPTHAGGLRALHGAREPALGLVELGPSPGRSGPAGSRTRVAARGVHRPVSTGRRSIAASRSASRSRSLLAPRRSRTGGDHLGREVGSVELVGEREGVEADLLGARVSPEHREHVGVRGQHPGAGQGVVVGCHPDGGLSEIAGGSSSVVDPVSATARAARRRAAGGGEASAGRAASCWRAAPRPARGDRCC